MNIPVIAFCDTDSDLQVGLGLLVRGVPGCVLEGLRAAANARELGVSCRRCAASQHAAAGQQGAGSSSAAGSWGAAWASGFNDWESWAESTVAHGQARRQQQRRHAWATALEDHELCRLCSITCSGGPWRQCQQGQRRRGQWAALRAGRKQLPRCPCAGTLVLTPCNPSLPSLLCPCRAWMWPSPPTTRASTPSACCTTC